ncbi:hypothetical protein [Bacillus pseudomycoides]|uniref:hypothetical protein n=1 Tax=Bacillus pseudomycoides TaxID=64104 RepID=UPI001FB4A016|nr:hypothetical protein [Bacillus pseudomycoides]
MFNNTLELYIKHPFLQHSFEEFETLKDLRDFLYLYAKLPVKPETNQKLLSTMLAAVKQSKDKKAFIEELNNYNKMHGLLDGTYDSFIVNYDMYVENKSRSLSPSVHS